MAPASSLVLALCLLGSQLASAAPNPPLATVALDYGTFTGQTNASTGIISFRGIRFADAPVKALRWRAPVSPPSKKMGRVDASEFGPACIATTQKASGATTDEDCLFGNVYVPSTATTTSKLPVLVYIYGGGFESGRTTKYPPEDLMSGSANPFIMATFGYRLGQFGFLGGAAVKADGALNVGLLDQKAALRWVNRYISKFAGDPSRVTIWGQSAGAGSVIYHLINRSTTDTGVPLFQQAMGDSPPLLSLLDYDDDFVEGLFSTFAVNAGCNKTTDAATMKCLRSVDQDVLANAGKRTLETAPNSLYPFGPMFDGDFISQRPAQALLTGNFAAVPVLFGSNSDEGANWSAKLPPGGGANTSSASATESTVFNFLAGQYTSLTRETFDDALRGPTEEDDDDTALYPLSDYAGQYSLQGQQMYGEMRYICTGLLVAGAVRRAGKVAYEYHWDNPVLGSTHSDERVAFFETPSPLDEANTNLVGAMREFWTSFVTTGTPESSASASTAEWMPSTENGSPRILLSPEGIRMEEVDPALAARCQFWWESAEELQI
ncbi:Carboxylic ester hydrolase [Mycena kentingensis (nom. inval.)]|nr:Carboxylic ester hydrolase [Mycena kentingensis (nom. inval.)]